MPVPMMNILNGGAHAASNVDVQEFMVVPHGFDSFGEGLRAGVETYHALKAELRQDGLLGGIGDEEGSHPTSLSNEDGLRYLVRAIEAAGYSTEQMGIALDVASTEFHRDGATTSTGRPSTARDWPTCIRDGWTSTPSCPSRTDLTRTTGLAGPGSRPAKATVCRSWATTSS